jgi:hypothetical protein
MVSWLFKYSRQHFKGISASTPEPPVPPPPGALPLESAHDLLASRWAAVARIEELAGTTRPHFERYYLDAIHRFAAWTQQLPASEAHYPAYSGGLLDHGVEAAIAALRRRRGCLLPPDAPPEEAVLKRDLWTYAVFTLALLHDAAKPAVDHVVTLFDAAGTSWPWNPWTGALGEDPRARWYRAEFRRDRCEALSRPAAPLLVPWLIRPEGLAWLTTDPALFAAWLAFLEGDATRAGPFTALLAPADRAPEVQPLPLDKPRATYSALSDSAALPFTNAEALPERPPPAVVASSPPIPEPAGLPVAPPDPVASVSPVLSEPAEHPTHAPHSQVEPSPPMTARVLGEAFLRWVIEGLRTGRLDCNTDRARVHVVAEGVLLASPGLFKDYAVHAGLAEWNAVQRALFKLQIHTVTSAGLNVHRYAFAGGAILNGVLIADMARLFGTASPEPNPRLSPM